KLVKGPGNYLLAATVPMGHIYKVTPDGKATLLVQLPANHIWDLAVKGTTLYAATGPDASLFSININTKKATKVWSVKEDHLLSIALDSKGEILVGTSPEARLYRVSPTTKKGTLVYDFPGNEIRQIIVGKKSVFVAANQLTYRASTSYATNHYKAAGKKHSGTRAALTANPKSSFTRRSVVQGSGTLYALDSRRIAEPMLAIQRGYFTKIQREGDEIYGADGQSGRIYRMNVNDFSGAIVLQTEERQVLDFVIEKEKSGFVATGDGAALYTLSRSQGKAVNYESVVLNAQRAAQFGNVLFQLENGLVNIETRSGATPKPEDTLWSPWRALAGVHALPSGLKQGKVISPGAQYIQFRVLWPAGSKASLKSLQLFFTPSNLKPRIIALNVSGATSGGYAGANPQSDSVIPATPRMRSGEIKFSWSVLNWDGDSLIYKVWVKKAGDKLWRRLAARKTLTSTYYTWQAGFVPDGVYVVKVSASDSPSNVPGQELTSEKISLPFVIDNRAPLLTGLTVRNGMVNFSVADKFSRITGASYRIAGGKWKMVLPVDSLFDSMKEKFRFPLCKTLPRGVHLIQVRVMDAAGNIATFSQEFTK
ncbi:hypothetical protein KJ865_15125, partial [Myxococcota bacterium]|nr:hypothetical protein [Myxococcota bacterium]